MTAACAEGYPASRAPEKFIIEFDRSQVIITTDVDRIADFIRTTYRYMLVDHARTAIGNIDIRRTVDGFALRSVEPLLLQGDSCEPLMPYLKEEVLLL